MIELQPEDIDRGSCFDQVKTLGQFPLWSSFALHWVERIIIIIIIINVIVAKISIIIMVIGVIIRSRQKYMVNIMIDVIDNLMIWSCCWYRKCLRCYQSTRWPIFLYLPHDLDGCLCIATLQIAPKENFIDDTSASSSWSLGQSRPTAGKALRAAHWAPGRKWEVMIFRDKHTLYHNIYIYRRLCRQDHRPYTLYFYFYSKIDMLNPFWCLPSLWSQYPLAS